MTKKLIHKGFEKLRHEGFREFTLATYRFLFRAATDTIRTLTRPIYIPVLSLIAKARGPVEYYGVCVPTQSDAFDTDVRSRFLRNTYEREEIEAINRYLTTERDLIDLGASTGFLTVYAMNHSDVADAVAVEANPDLIDLLETTREINKCDFRILHAAYHPTESKVEFNQHRLTVGGSVQRETDRQTTVPGMSLAGIIEETGVSEPVVIADIEGGEVDLILNELSTLETYCPLLIVEFHGSFVDGVDNAKDTLGQSMFELVDEFRNVAVYRNRSIE